MEFKKYLYLQYEQFDQIEEAHKAILNAKDKISELCKEDIHDINIGFVLGETYSDLSKHFVDLMMLLSEIKNQKNEYP